MWLTLNYSLILEILSINSRIDYFLIVKSVQLTLKCYLILAILSINSLIDYFLIVKSVWLTLNHSLILAILSINCRIRLFSYAMDTPNRIPKSRRSKMASQIG